MSLLCDRNHGAKRLSRDLLAEGARYRLRRMND